MKRSLAPIRRPEILATAVELVREQGLWSVRVADVAERAGMSPGSVIYHFGSKEQLFVQAIADADAAFYAELWPELEAIEDATGRMACLIRRSSTSDWVLWLDLWVYARRHPKVLSYDREFHRRWVETIAAVVRYGQERGEFRSDVDAEAVATRLAAVANGLAVRMVLDECPNTREHYVEMSATSAALELDCDPVELRQAIEAVPEVPATEEAGVS